MNRLLHLLRLSPEYSQVAAVLVAGAYGPAGGGGVLAVPEPHLDAEL
jgi:hypothetical protein